MLGGTTSRKRDPKWRAKRRSHAHVCNVASGMPKIAMTAAIDAMQAEPKQFIVFRREVEI
jgi:hypothetical protein